MKWLEDDSFQRRAITSISNSTGWFFRLKDSQIAILMQDPAGIEWQLVGLLSVMINRMPEETLALLKKIWLINSDRDAFTFHVFDQFTHWSEETVRTVCQIIDRTQINESFVTDIASKVSVQEPELAPKILATEFKKKLQAIQLLSEHRKKELPPEVTTEEEMSAFWMFASKTQFGELLESSSGRYGMDAIAEAAPLEFLKQMWPLFLEALEPTLDMPHHILNRFRTSSALHYQYRSEYSPEQPFLDAIRSALRELTSIDPSAFEIFVRNTFCIDAMLVQRMVCLSLVEQDAILVELSLDFLISDPRRLLIGDYQDSHRDSRNLIAKLAPKLSTEQLQQLEQSINNWTMYHSEIPDQTAEDKRDRMKWDRESRLRLLMAIPKHLLSEKAKSILGAEEVALPTVKARLERSETRDEMTQVISPMSTEQMKKANNAQILKLFDRLTDDTDWTHPRRGLRGGTVEASRALAELAKEYPERASELATQFRCSDQQIPVAHIVEALSVSDYPTERLFDLIRDLVKLGFNSQNFQETVASACALRGYQLDGLPDDICDLLKSWLDTWIFSIENNADDRELGESKEDKERSILFDQREWIEIPQGTYAIMSAIAFGLIRKIPPATDDWLTELNKHLERPEKLRTWQVFGRELRMLEYCDQAKAVRFLEELFVKYPKVRDSIQGVDLLGYLRNFIKEEAFITFIDQIAASEWSMGIQAKGELFGASYLVEDKFLSVDECIKFTVSSNVTADNRFLKGVAYSVAEFWKESRFQHKATELFEKLAERKSQEINQALGGVFLSDQFIPNKNSKRVLIATACHPGVIQVVNLYHFVELLELFTESEPELVLKLANILLDLIEYDSEDGNPRHIDLSDSVLTNIAITLQRRSDNFRGDGLDLFERLLRLGFSSTIQTMYELDNRPVNVIHHAQRRKRRKNRRRVD
ncbi:MAG: hypothetical protein KDA77_00670 [Planctomycetaceae bacterium]|nr:hypothetical protein [Planctomycetaceae bacterium]